MDVDVRTAGFGIVDILSPSPGVVCNYAAVSKPKSATLCCAFLFFNRASDKMFVFETLAHKMKRPGV